MPRSSQRSVCVQSFRTRSEWLDRGIIKAHGPVDEVYAEYQEWLNAKTD